jgi:hypothetical protein
LQVSQPTVSRDLTELNRVAQKYLYTLAKNGMAPRYREALDTVALVKREGFRLYDEWRRANPCENNNMNAKYILGAFQSRYLFWCAIFVAMRIVESEGIMTLYLYEALHELM